MIAERLRKIKPSPTLAITSKAKKLKAEGEDIVSLAAGEPDFDTPQFIKDAAIEAIRQGFTKYTPTSGTSELKKTISEKFRKDNFLDYSAEQIVVSCGAKHSIFNALFVLLNKGDEVLIPSPYWVSYPEMVNLCEGKSKFIESRPEDNFKITPKELEKNITSKTKILLLNSPSNPTGSVYVSAQLKEIADICIRNKIFVISDEIYEKIIFDGLKAVSIASLGKDIYDLVITVNGLSKSFSMTGWRIGYLGASREIAEAVSKVQDHSTSNPNSIAQKAAVAALKASNDFSNEICKEFCKRRDYVISRLEKMNKITFVKPEGAFYVFFDISKTGLDAQTTANRLLEEAKIAVIPGEGFGRKDYCRLSFATNIPQLERAMDRLELWLNRLN
ncbi:MAG: pyridoxal phosphate-dependent aminotransferase [Candidatus Omnitrophota bacterium]